MNNRQTKICCFIHSDQCKNKNHEYCKQIWKSEDVEVTCDCNCHKSLQTKLTDFVDGKEKDLVSDRESDQTTTEIGRMGTYSKIGASKNDKRRRK